MSRLLKYLISQPIANTGSVARDHLANERTFLSWTRTGLGFVALGVALAKLDALEALSLPSLAQLSSRSNPNLNPNSNSKSESKSEIKSESKFQPKSQSLSGSESEPERSQPYPRDMKIPAAALVASGTGCLSYGTVRYFRSLKLLQKGLFRPNLAGVGLVAVTSGAVAGGGVWLVLMHETGLRR